MNAQSSYTRPDETLCLENLHIGISGLVRRARSSSSRMQFFLNKDPSFIDIRLVLAKVPCLLLLAKYWVRLFHFQMFIYTFSLPGSLCWRSSDLPVYFEPVIDNTYFADFYQGTRAADVPTRVILLVADPALRFTLYRAQEVQLSSADLLAQQPLPSGTTSCCDER